VSILYQLQHLYAHQYTQVCTCRVCHAPPVHSLSTSTPAHTHIPVLVHTGKVRCT